MANAATVASLKRSRDNVAAIIETQTDAWVAAGMPPTFSVDGESYSWSEWLAARTKEITDLTDAIVKVSGPWVVRHRGRA